MKGLSAIFSIMILSVFVLPLTGQWKKTVIDDNITTAVSVDTADLDGDSRPDLLVPAFGDNELVWYQNNFPSWTKQIINANASGVTFAYCGDMDGNDTVDVVANLYGSRKIVWYENQYSTWTEHNIDNLTDYADHMLIADLNGDGSQDVVATGDLFRGGDVVWYENNHPDWIEHIIVPGTEKYPGLNISDIDGDGFSDIVASMSEANRVVWFKNENNGLTWTQYTIDENLIGAFCPNHGDIDGDDTVDIVVTTGGPYLDEGSEVVWYKQRNQGWTKHIIDADLPGATWPIVTDVDGDDTMDVVVSAYKANSLVWYENNHPTWIKHVIDNDVKGPREFLIMDVDGDLFEDIITCAENSVVWYKHPGNTAFATFFKVSSYSFQSSDDTLTIKVNMHNPENHPMNIYAVVEGEQSQFIDTITLFDDGMHEDGDSSDHIWAIRTAITVFPEDEFEAELIAYDSTTGNFNDYLPPEQFITFGPVSFEDYTITSSHKVFTPGELIELSLTLKNNGQTAVVKDIYAKLASLDPNVLVSGTRGFGDIAAGEISISDRSFQIKISDTCPVDTFLPVALDILYEFQKCWRDTFLIYVYEEQPVSIPDTVFLYALIDEGVDTNGDSLISSGEAEAVTSLDVSGKQICNGDSCWSDGRQIASLEGIEAFVNLNTLSCSDNQLSNLDVSGCTVLKSLECQNNKLTSLDVSANPSLEFLSCFFNQLTSLDLSNNTALICLMCQDNQITVIDVSGCTLLNGFNCSNNLLTSLDVSKNTELGSSISCSYGSGFNINGMPSLYEVCVWEGFSPDSIYIGTEGSPNVCFQPDCNGDCSIVGIDNLHEAGISIYPNPTYNLLTIETSTSDPFDIELTSLSGQILLNKVFEGASHQLDLSSFPKGEYR